MENNSQLEGDFFANGKLLLAGEYFVLDGATAFAVPTRKGQHLKVDRPISKDFAIHWKSLDQHNQTWFEAKFGLKDLNLITSSDESVALRLQAILKYIFSKKSTLFNQPLSFTTQVEFDRKWGLGTSSTLLANLASWSNLNPYELASKTFGGSGYDLACAKSDTALFFQKNGTFPAVTSYKFKPAFLDKLFLVWLGKKQDSRQGIETYRSKGKVDTGLLRQVSQLSQMMAKAADLGTFCSCIQELERLTGDFIEKEPLQENIFKEIPGAVKSLGAWGGDFALIATPWEVDKVKDYCAKIGLPNVFLFNEIVRI